LTRSQFFFLWKNMNKRLMLGTSIFVTHSVDLAEIISPSVKFMCFSCIWNIWLLYGHKVSHHYCLQCLLQERIHHSWRMKKVIFDHQDYLFYHEVMICHKVFWDANFWRLSSWSRSPFTTFFFLFIRKAKFLIKRVH